MKEWIVGSLSTMLGLEENVKCQGAQSAMVKGNVFWGGPLGSPNILTRKHKCLYEQLITYISTQKAVNVNHPYTDGSNALRVVMSTLPGPLLLPAPKPPEKLLQERLNSVCRLPKSPCLFFLIQLNSSIYP